MSELPTSNPRVERFEYPSQYALLARVLENGDVEVCQDIDELERILHTAWDLQHRALARLVLEIARLRAAHETPAIPADAQVIPGRLGHADWCPAANLPSCNCGAAESAFDAFGQPKPLRPAVKARSRRSIQTEECPGCHTVHDKPLCPAPNGEGEQR